MEQNSSRYFRLRIAQFKVKIAEFRGWTEIRAQAVYSMILWLNKQVDNTAQHMSWGL
jgi:hypothetical protein